jgi:hypothetical protein
MGQLVNFGDGNCEDVAWTDEIIQAFRVGRLALAPKMLELGEIAGIFRHIFLGRRSRRCLLRPCSRIDPHRIGTSASEDQGSATGGDYYRRRRKFHTASIQNSACSR